MARTVEKYLATHCAPVLYLRKPAALLPNKMQFNRYIEEKLISHGLQTLIIPRDNGQQLLLLYNPVMLRKVLATDEISQTLEKTGYPINSDLDAQLDYLCKRFYRSNDFPHEVGFFLGYPPEDVFGFMTCKDKCKLCGPWKVYGDVEKATALFKEYALCRTLLVAHVENGGSIFGNDLPALAG